MNIYEKSLFEFKNFFQINDWLDELIGSDVQLRIEKKNVILYKDFNELKDPFIINLGSDLRVFISVELSGNNLNRFKDLVVYVSQVLELSELVYLDDVTKFGNQRKIYQDLNNFITQEKSFYIFFIDVDHFKNINDKGGHLAGSDLLLQVGTIIKSCLRGSDEVYRYGGDEFLVMLPDIHKNNAYEIATRILNDVADREYAYKNFTYDLSVSIGIASYPLDAQNIEGVIEFADKMMYESKKKGRGKVYHINEVI